MFSPFFHFLTTPFLFHTVALGLDQQFQNELVYPGFQAEEYYIPVESLCRQMQNVKVSSLLKSELVLLKGLRYDLIVHAPFIEIDGFLEVCMLQVLHPYNLWLRSSDVNVLFTSSYLSILRW